LKTLENETTMLSRNVGNHIKASSVTQRHIPEERASHFQIFGRQDFPSALETGDIRSATNSRDIIGQCRFFGY